MGKRVIEILLSYTTHTFTLRAHNRSIINRGWGPVSDEYVHKTTYDQLAPSVPSTTDILSILSVAVSGSILLRWAQETDRLIKRYQVYVNTSDDPDTAKIFKRFYGTSALVSLGDKSEDQTIEIEAGETYYFWVTAIDESENESDKTYLGAEVFPSGGGGGGHTIQDEGTPLTQRTNLNFVGSVVEVTDDVTTDTTVVTIVGGIISRGGTVLVPTEAISVIVWYATFACTVTNIRGYRVGGTGATINARRNGSSNHLSSALSLTSADTWMDGGAVQNTAYAIGDKLEIMIVSVAGDPDQVAVQIDFEV